MTDDPARDEIRSALAKAVSGSPLSLFAQITPAGDSVAEQFNATLEDGTAIVFERRTIAVQVTDAMVRDENNASRVLADGVYRLKDGSQFTVANGRFDFDALLADPDGVHPFRQYHAWRETVAIDNALLSLPDPLAITDVVRSSSPSGEHYYCVQFDKAGDYRGYLAVNRKLQPLDNGEYAIGGGAAIRIENGGVHPDSVADMKANALKSSW